MTKRAMSKFERREFDFYPTPEKAVLPLLPYLEPNTRFYEPCAGNGSLSAILVKHGHICMGMSDANPRDQMVEQLEINEIRYRHVKLAQTVITNPPWERPTMHRLINHLLCLTPMWLLLESDWLFTQQAAPFLMSATDIVAIGRVRWIPGSASDGFDNCCWVRFDMTDGCTYTPAFHARAT